MKINVDISKDKVDEVLMKRVKKLEGENSKLLQQNEKLKSQIESHKCKVLQFDTMVKHFQDILKEYSIHTDCYRDDWGV